MSHVCRTCSRVNPPEALYCYHDGVALDSHRGSGPIAMGARPFANPFVLPSGRQCRNFDELVLACDSDWEGAKDVLQQGFLEAFLGGLGRADLALAARQAAKEADADRGLDQLLGKLPATQRDHAKLSVQPLEINLGQLAGGAEPRFVLTLENQGAGLLHGSVATEESDWLALGDSPGSPRKLFQCRHDVALPVHVVLKNLRAGSKPVEGRLVVESNAGTALVVVRAERAVVPFAEGVLAGAKSPRQIAERAKASPKEAAPLFEGGQVAAWYEANGWTYPVQGPPASGIGAIQQFFEALGLVQAPRVEISESALRLQGKPGTWQEIMLHVRTREKRPVFAHATTSTAWLQVGRAIFEGRSASIPVRVPSVPATPGETLQGKVFVTANGNQRFTVEVSLTVTGTRVGAKGDGERVLDLTDALAEPVASLPSEAPFVLAAGREVRSDRSVPEPERLEAVLPVVTAEAIAPTAPRSAVSVTPPPLPKRPRRDDEDVPQPTPLLPFIGPILPLGALALAMFCVFVHDLFVRADRALPPPPPPLDNTPLLAVRFHDGDKPFRIANEPKPQEPTMRFGLLMRREEDGRNVAFTADDLKELRGPTPADADRFKRLTFDDWGQSNNTCLRVDGQETLFGMDPAGGWEKLDERLGDDRQGARSVWLLRKSKVAVTQTIEIIRGEQSGRLDTCLVRYTLENRDTRRHNVGIRFLLDTFIGDNDGVPFTVPGEAGLCDTDKTFDTPDQVPDYIEALEKPDLRNPGTIARLQFRLGSKLESPGRVILGGWPDSNLPKVAPRQFPKAHGGHTLWEVPVVSMQYLNQRKDVFAKDEQGRKIRVPKDSAVALYWNEQLLDGGQTREVGFTYGLGHVSSAEGEGHLLLTLGGRLVRGGEFTLTAVVHDPRRGEKLTLTLPKGFTLVGGGEEQAVPPGSGERNASTVTWRVRAGAEGDQTLHVKSSGGQTQSVNVKIRGQGVFD